MFFFLTDVYVLNITDTVNLFIYQNDKPTIKYFLLFTELQLVFWALKNIILLYTFKAIIRWKHPNNRWINSQHSGTRSTVQRGRGRHASQTWSGLLSHKSWSWSSTVDCLACVAAEFPVCHDSPLCCDWSPAHAPQVARGCHLPFLQNSTFKAAQCKLWGTGGYDCMKVVKAI